MGTFPTKMRARKLRKGVFIVGVLILVVGLVMTFHASILPSLAFETFSEETTLEAGDEDHFTSNSWYADTEEENLMAFRYEASDELVFVVYDNATFTKFVEGRLLEGLYRYQGNSHYYDFEAPKEDTYHFVLENHHLYDVDVLVVLVLERPWTMTITMFGILLSVIGGLMAIVGFARASKPRSHMKHL